MNSNYFMAFQLIDFILHVDKYLGELIQLYGAWIYGFLFLIIFIETGLVIMPFLPGDSLLFVAGTFAASGAFNIWLLFVILCIAAIVGDTVNYWLGKYFGEKVFSRFIRQEYMDRTKEFYDKHGKKTIILARFVPIVRTFAPFVAGIGEMNYFTFLSYNVIGGIVWVALFLFAGFFFGNIPIIKENLTWVIYAIVVVSVMPIVVEYLRGRRR